MNHINQVLLEFENWNVKAKVSGIVFRKFIRDPIRDEAVRRMAMHQEYADDRDWIEALRQAGRDEEDFKEGKRLKENNFRGSNSSGKRKREKPTRSKTTKTSKYTAKEKRVYQAKKKEEMLEKGKAGPQEKIIHRIWADTHPSIDQKIGDERKGKWQCTRCTLSKDG